MAYSLFRKTIFLVSLVFFLTGGKLVHAIFNDQTPLSVKLLSSSTHMGSHNTFLMGIQIELSEGWHIYAPQKNTSFIPPHLQDKGSKNIYSYKIFWPTPHKISLNGEEGLVYSHKILLPLIISLKNSTLPLDVNMLFVGVACNQKQCVPYKIPLSLSIPAGPLRPTQEATILKDALKNSSSSPPAPHEKSFIDSFTALLIILGSGFLGGIILNFMPCVLPVLSIKLFSLLEKKILSNTLNTHLIKMRFLISFLGILSFFMVFAFLTIALHYFGKTLGWGIHFQNPYFLGCLIIILLLFTLNLWGVFEVRLPSWILNWVSHKNSFFYSERNKPQSSFYDFFLKDFASGLLTAILATPCTAPFLGTALGASLTQSPAVVILIFFSIGTGLGAPYLIMMIYPSLIHKLPHPGAWMQKLRYLLSLGLLGTSLWLGFVLLSPLTNISVSSSQTLSWQIFSTSKLSSYINTGHHVLVNVTADWCLTCKANKFFTFENEEVQKFLLHKKIILIEADWTRPNPDIELYLKDLNKRGIPLTIYYTPQNPHGIILPELLTPSRLIDFLNNH